LVVVAIVALASAGAVVALRDSAHAGLETQAQALAALLESGRAQSRASGIAVRWVATENGFALDGKAQAWQIPGVQAHSAQPLLLGPEPVIPPQSVTLWLAEQPQRRLRVATDGLRPFAVDDAAPQALK
jgi:general secretion pathway protein H